MKSLTRFFLIPLFSPSYLFALQDSNLPVHLQIDGVALEKSRTAPLMKRFPPHVPIEINVDPAGLPTGQDFELELPAGTNAICVTMGTPPATVSFQKFGGNFVQLEGDPTTGIKITQFDDGPRISISVDQGAGSIPVVITTDSPKCECTETSCSKTGTTPEVESPASSLSPVGLTDSFPLGLACCNSGQVPGTAVWAPADLSGWDSGSSWNSLDDHLVTLPNSNMLGSGLSQVRSGNTEQWRTGASLVEFKSEPGMLTVLTLLDPPLTTGNDGLYDTTGLCELTRTVIEAGSEVGEILYTSYFEGVEVQKFTIKETTEPNTPVNGKSITTVTRTDHRAGLITKVETVKTLATGEMATTTTRLYKNDFYVYARSRETHALKAGWYRLVERVDAFESNLARITSYDLFDSKGHAHRILYGDGSWLVRLDAHGSIPGATDIKIRPFLDSPSPAGSLANLQSMNLDSYEVSYSQGSTSFTRIQGETTAREDRGYSFSPDKQLVTEAVTRFRNAGSSLTEERTFHTFGHPNHRLRGKPLSTRSSTGRIQNYEYAFGAWNPLTQTWTANSGGEDLRIQVTDNHATLTDLANRGRRSISFQNIRGERLQQQEQINEGGGVFSTYSTTTIGRSYPGCRYGKKIEIVTRDGRVIRQTIEESSFQTTTIDETGKRFVTIKDSAGRTVSRERFFDHLAGRSSEKTSYSYAADTTTTTRQAGPNVTTSTQAVDLLGRTTRVETEEGKVTTYEYPDPQTTLTRFLGVVVSKSIRYLDGSAKEEYRVDPSQPGNPLVLVGSSTREILPGGDMKSTQTGFGKGP